MNLTNLPGHGSRPSSYESSGKIYLYSIFFLVAFLFFSILANSQSHFKRGYFIAICEHKKKPSITKTIFIDQVKILSENSFPGNGFNFSQELSNSPYFTIENLQKQFYVEVKRIDSKGRYRRLNKRTLNQLSEFK